MRIVDTKQAAKAIDATEIRSLLIDPTTPGSCIEMKAPSIGANHAQIQLPLLGT
tara:strand:+ start:335 stop:496 length:162 start_codon:yes stop_codon:yes gene_type:complete